MLDTKQKIINHAIELYSKHGIHWVGFQQIAEKVGISQPAIYKHFSDKDDLLKNCIEHVFDTDRHYIDEKVSKFKEPSKQLKAYLTANIELSYKRRSHNAIILSMIYFSINSRSILDLYTTTTEQGINRIKSLLQNGKEQKIWKLKDPNLTARNIHNLLVGESIKATLNPAELDIESRIKVLIEATEEWIKA